MRLLLFDIDGTLLKCGPQVRGIFSGALEEIFGRRGPLEGFDFSGKTDRQIVLELMTAAGVERDVVRKRLPLMRDLYLERLETELDADRMEPFPDVARILEALLLRPDLVLGLLTGNWRGGAMIKLGRLGLDRFFEFGAFGDDGEDRPELVPVAWRRARAHCGHTFDADRTIIIGDSVQDVRCGRAHGVPVVAVTTGWTSAERLRVAGASWVAGTLAAAIEASGVSASTRAGRPAVAASPRAPRSP